MQKENDCMKRFEKVNNIISHPELDSGSSTLAVTQGKRQRRAWKTPYKSRGDNLYLMGFTLIELLVVVLIIGILVAIALPQYQKTVEKARMTEAITILRAIANANQVFYLANGRYADEHELELLDVQVPGELDTVWGLGRIRTKYFVYAPGGSGGGSVDFIAIAQRTKTDVQSEENRVYYLYIKNSDPDKIHCVAYQDGVANAVQRKLCAQIESNGTL